MTDTEKILVENLCEALKGSQRYVLLAISAALSLLLLQVATGKQGGTDTSITLPGLVVSASPNEVRMLLIGVIILLPSMAVSANAHANKIAKKILNQEIQDAALTYPSLATDADPWIRRGSAVLPIVPVMLSQFLWFLSQTDRNWFDFTFWSLMIVMPSIVLTLELRNPVGFTLESKPMNTKPLPQDYDHIAPDGSEIRLLSQASRGGLAHCTLPKNGVSTAVKHKTVEEIWYFLSGQGEVWRQEAGGEERVVEVMQGISLTISTGTSFQFRNARNEPLCFIIATMPPWPGAKEAIKTDGNW